MRTAVRLAGRECSDMTLVAEVSLDVSCFLFIASTCQISVCGLSYVLGNGSFSVSRVGLVGRGMRRSKRHIYMTLSIHGRLCSLTYLMCLSVVV